jgi:hypothetical protein
LSTEQHRPEGPLRYAPRYREEATGLGPDATNALIEGAANHRRCCLFTAYVVVAVIATTANSYAAASDFIRPKWLLANMTKLGVSESWLTKLGVLKAAGALGVLVGIRVPLIGVAAAVGLIRFFVGASIIHLRSRPRYANRIPSAGHRRTNTGTICAGAGRVCAGGEVAGIIKLVRPNRIRASVTKNLLLNSTATNG